MGYCRGAKFLPLEKSHSGCTCGRKELGGKEDEMCPGEETMCGSESDDAAATTCCALVEFLLAMVRSLLSASRTV